jgi:hypothetical protein
MMKRTFWDGQWYDCLQACGVGVFRLVDHRGAQLLWEAAKNGGRRGCVMGVLWMKRC